MATDYFIGRDMAWKKAMLAGVQESMMTGNMVKIQTQPGVFTEYDPTTNHPDQLIERLCYSIANDPNFNAADPVQAACAANGRPGITRAKFC